MTMTIETCSSSAPDLAQNMCFRWTIRLVKGWVTRRVQFNNDGGETWRHSSRQRSGGESGRSLEADPERYGLPQREYGSVLIGSFNIRKLGSARSRNRDTWEFLADVCRSFDLLAVQEIMDNLSGLRRLMSLLGPEFSMVVSDQTGVFPGEPGVGERLGFIYRWNTVERMEVASDVTYDRVQGNRFHRQRLRHVHRRHDALRPAAGRL